MNLASVGYQIGTNYLPGPPEQKDDEIMATISGGPVSGLVKALIWYV
jgi:hypothetical protein